MIAMTLLFTGCSQPQETEVEETPVVEAPAEETPVVEEEATVEETPSEVTKPFVLPEGTEVTDKYVFDQFAILLPDTWIEVNTTVDEVAGVWNLAAKNGIMLQLSVVKDEIKVVDEMSIEDEVSLDSYLHLEEKTEVVLDNGTHFFGAYIEDHATETQFCYYLAKEDNKVIAVLFNKKSGYTEEDVVWMHEILGTFEIIE